MARNRTRLGAVGVALLSAVAVRGKLRRYVIAEESMGGSLESGDQVLAVRPRRIPSRGDVVIYRDPLGTCHELVKRIIGLPHEEITIANGQVHVNGAVLAEHWANGPTMPNGSWQLDGKHVFTLGDARSRSSHDSRQSGPVPTASIEWRVVARYWPAPRVV